MTRTIRMIVTGAIVAASLAAPSRRLPWLWDSRARS